MGPRVPFALLPLGIYLSNKVFKEVCEYMCLDHNFEVKLTCVTLASYYIPALEIVLPTCYSLNNFYAKILLKSRRFQDSRFHVLQLTGHACRRYNVYVFPAIILSR